MNSNEKNDFRQDRKGLINQSNISNLSCKTYQPVKEINQGKIKIER